MKLEAVKYSITKMHSAIDGVVELTVADSQESQALVFQIITYTGKPVTLSNHIIDAIEANDSLKAHQLSSLFLSIYYLNKEQVDDFMRSKYEARKLSV